MEKLANSGYRKRHLLSELYLSLATFFFSLSISHVEGTILKRCRVRNLVLHSHVVFQFMDLGGVLGTPLNRASENWKSTSWYP